MDMRVVVMIGLLVQVFGRSGGAGGGDGTHATGVEVGDGLADLPDQPRAKDDGKVRASYEPAQHDPM